MLMAVNADIQDPELEIINRPSNMKFHDNAFRISLVIMKYKDNIHQTNLEGAFGSTPLRTCQHINITAA